MAPTSRASSPLHRHDPRVAITATVVALAALLWGHGLLEVARLASWVAQTPEVCAGMPSFAALGAGGDERARLLVASDLAPAEHVRAFFCAQYELAPLPLGRAEPGWAALAGVAATLAPGDRIGVVLPAPGAAEEAQRLVAAQLAGRGIRVERRAQQGGLVVLAVLPAR